MRVKVNRKLILLLPALILACMVAMLPGVTGATSPPGGGSSSGDFTLTGCVVSASGSGERRGGTNEVRVYKLSHRVIKIGTCTVAKSVDDAGVSQQPPIVVEDTRKGCCGACGGSVTTKLIDKNK
jgi:hypothetical protein